MTFTSPLAHAWAGTPLGLPLVPTQLLESMIEFVNFLLLIWLFRHRKFEGQVIGGYLLLYGSARYFLEYLRDDPGRGSVFGGAMSGIQLISILLMIVGASLWLRRTMHFNRYFVLRASSTLANDRFSFVDCFAPKHFRKARDIVHQRIRFL